MSADASATQERIHAIAERLATSVSRRPRADAEREREASLLTGAAYSLLRASRLGFDPAAARVLSRDEGLVDLSRALEDLARPVSGLLDEPVAAHDPALVRWLAGHAFVSAVLRLAAANDRLAVPDVADGRVGRYANWAKHGDDARYELGRREHLPDMHKAVRALALLVAEHARRGEIGR